MPQVFVVDQAATFSATALLECSPRVKFGSKTGEQETLKDGTLVWDVQVVCGFRDNFGNSKHEVITIKVNSGVNPGKDLGPYTPVQLVRFVVGVTDPKEVTNDRGEKKIIGGKPYYGAEAIRPLHASVPAQAVPVGAKSKEV